VDATNELSKFLTSRRAKVTPEQAGLRSYGRRQVPGLRREEVASLAGVSVDYYNRLERGNATGVSDIVLEALADALQLEDAERAHLFDLARAASPVSTKRARGVSPQTVRPVVQRIVDSIASPATVSNMRGDYLTANVLGRGLTDLVGELSMRSEPFRKWWGTHDVRYHQTGRKRLHHPVVGDVELEYEVMAISAGSGLRLAVFTADPGTRSAEALSLLGALAATTAAEERAPAPDRGGD
jgi:transcriptional regulator with XRE-family HTH domain